MISIPDYLVENRNRLILLLERIPVEQSPPGWAKQQSIAISSFLGFGFSKLKTNLALIVSSSGRSVLIVVRVKKFQGIIMSMKV